MRYFTFQTNLRPGDFIRNLYQNIVSRLSAIKFEFHSRAQKGFNRHKRSRDTTEEYCTEEWNRMKKIFPSYRRLLSSVKNSFEGLEQLKISKKYPSKSIHWKPQKQSELRNNYKSLIIRINTFMTKRGLNFIVIMKILTFHQLYMSTFTRR